MWHDSLKIGVEKIDEQHKMLFSKVEQLIDELVDTGEYHKDNVTSIILFLKDYAVTHFADEEAYQLSINEVNYLQHKMLHENFVETVLEHEKRLIASDFAQSDVSKFTGTLLAWLAYHVSEVDQKIGKAAEVTAENDNHTDLICECFCNVISNYVNMNNDTNTCSVIKAGNHDETFEGSVTIRHYFTHILEGYVVFDYSSAFISELMYSLTGIPLDKIGNFEKTFLLQISTIIIENIYRRLYVDKYNFSEMKILIVDKDETYPEERIAFDTGMGIVDVGFSFV